MKIVCLTLVLLLAKSSNGQVLLSLIFGDKLNSGNVMFGIHTNFSMNRMSGYDQQDALYKFNLGLFLTWKLNERWHANVEALAKYSRGAASLPAYTLEDPVLDSVYNQTSFDRKVDYLALPLSMRYFLHKRWFIEAGFQPAIRINASDEFETETIDGELTLKKKIKDETSRWDIALLGGVGYQMGKTGTGVSLSLRYNHSFPDVMKNEAGTQAHRGFYIGANIPVGRGKMERKKQEAIEQHNKQMVKI